jgi:hypothetical protein
MEKLSHEKERVVTIMKEDKEEREKWQALVARTYPPMGGGG